MLTLHITLPALFDNAFVHVYTSVLLYHPHLKEPIRSYIPMKKTDIHFINTKWMAHIS